MLIDGGAASSPRPTTALAELGITDLPLVGVAKGPDRDAGRETFYMPGREPVHAASRATRCSTSCSGCATRRTASPSARTGRAGKIDMARNPLDEIAGIGPTRKRALLRHFGTAKAVSRASIEDLVAVEGISAQMARMIHDHFHEQA